MEIVWLSLLCLVVSTAIIIYYKWISLKYNGQTLFLGSFMLISAIALLLNGEFIDIRKDNNILVPILAGLFLFYFYSLYRSFDIAPNPGYPIAIISIHILLVAVISALLFGSHINKYTIMGIIITIIGIYLLIKNLSKK